MRVRLLSLVRVNLRRDLRGALLSALGVAAGIGTLVFFLALGGGVGDVVRTKVFPADARLIEVVPPTVSLGLLGGGRLDEAAVERLAALDGVEAAHRKMQLRVPAVTRYDGQFFGQRLRMGLEILAVGVDPALVAADVVPGVAFADPGEGGGPIPALISGRLLEIYNGSFAKGRGLPSLTPRLLRGFEFPVEYGRSYVGGKVVEGPSLRQPAVFAGVSDRALLQGLTLPLDTVRRLNRRFGADAETYSSVALVAETPDHVPAIAAAVRGLGFEIDDTERRLAESIGAAVAIVTAALALISLLICALAAVNIALSLGAAVRSRAREFGVLRAVGATSGDVFRLVAGEAAVIGLAGGLVGGLLARAAAWGVDWAAHRYLPDFPFRPDTFFVFPAWVLAGAVLLGVLAALAGAATPARAAARLDPARVMGA
jgi:putative ABC transport system permease protein